MSAGQLPTLVVERRRFQLSCGANLIVSPRPGAPVTAVRFHVRGGNALDPEGKEGLAYLSGQLTDQGTAKYDESELAAIVEPAGGAIAGHAQGLTGSIAGDSWKLLLDMMSELFCRAAYPSGPVAVQRERIVDRLKVQEDEPQVVGGHMFRGLIYGDHHLGRSEHGTAATVSKLTAKDLRSHHKLNSVGERLGIAVCGDVDPAKVKRHLEKLLRDLPRGRAFERMPERFPKLGNRVAAFTKRREQAHVYLGHLGVRRAVPDWAAIVVMDHVLGSGPGFTNRISRILRDEQGLAYSVHADLHSSAGLAPGAFSAYIGTSPENVPIAVAGFLREIRRIQDEPVGREELEMAKDYLLGSFVMGYERASRRAGYLIGAELHQHPEDHFKRLSEAYAAVTAADVQAAARAYLHPDDCCLVAAGPIRAKELRALLA